ncbi:MAG: hypothetical protein HN567_03280 [Actinobacteria bacterium]|jgi:hypothetical protein|nr:hypothetical protein [Actinomycetota bacterium]MBT3745769.1 hypothetical protein [Actinomycetota bacterium]MBT3969040.1 hypothetical protein [Actinomycetota bacterium]MBT4010565.1 hypothetical protein [Actinomycetota bacterium]MBT4302217.1 hypothetical protein [Actinomycetota bacterium]
MPAGHRVENQKPLPPGEVVLVDVDGVLSDASGRQYHLDGPKKDWLSFFEASTDDPPIMEGVRLVAQLAAKHPVVLVTARPGRLADLTINWMERHGVRWDLLAMRTDGDHGASFEVKRRILAGLRADGYQPILAIDDEAKNLSMYRSEGVPTVYVHSGYYQ